MPSRSQILGLIPHFMALQLQPLHVLKPLPSTSQFTMAKPTFLQSLLNRPSQSYAFPAQKKQYHSQKKEFIRIAQSYIDEAAVEQESSVPAAAKSVHSSASSANISASKSAGHSSASVIPKPARGDEVRHDCTFFPLCSTYLLRFVAPGT